jgi:phosphoesterase RecJ-like protein
MSYPDSSKIEELLADANTVVIIQADNPDADSLGSALALEEILGDLGKEPVLYCGVDVPGYLRYLPGWDRVSNELPKQFDMSIIVDTSAYTLLGQLEKTGQLGTLKSKPVIVLDHHTSVEKPLDFAAASIIDDSVAATGELIFHLTKQLEWLVNKQAAEHIMGAILGDTQGLTNDRTTASTYRTMADLTEIGANRAFLEEQRRDFSRMPETVFRYKAQLIERMAFAAEGRIAHVVIPQQEINDYSPFYNPAVLVQFDSLQVENVQLSIIFKTYDSGRITGKLRASASAPVAARLAEHFGGGGHPHSAGFKIEDGRPISDIKSECLEFAAQLLDNLKKEMSDA